MSEARAAEAEQSIGVQIAEYLGVGGLFNPELMEHEKVRDLVIDSGIETDRLNKRVTELEALLRWLDKKGGLGVDVHDAIRGLLNG